MNTTVQVGSKVRALVSEIDLREGEIYTVLEIAGSGNVTVLDDVQDHHALYAHEYELVPEAPRFKEGDRVLIGSVSPSWESHVSALDSYTGQEGTVERVTEGGYVKLRLSDGDWWNWPAESLTLVTEDGQPAATVFLIAGMTTEYPTQEAAEAFLSEDGDNGKEYTITQVVRRVRVTRTTELQSI